MTRDIRVKFLARTPPNQDPALWLSLFAGRRPVIGRCHFTFDTESRDYDWLVVYEDLAFRPGESRSNRVEELACSQENTLFITTEPQSIKIYGPGYLGQFGHILTAQPPKAVKHEGHIQETPYLRWYYGRPLDPNDNNYTDLDTYKLTSPPTKPQDLSIVCSNKQMSGIFQQRYDFTKALKDILGDDLNWFGRGVRPIANKAEAMDGFRYHIAIENHIAPHHWTEKIADCFLAYCLPFYYGPPNIADYFPEDAIIPIDIYDIEGSAKIIRHAIMAGAYEKRLPAITEARRRVLDDYNLMNQIAKIVEAKDSPNATIANTEICGRHIYRKKHPIAAIGDALHGMRVKG